MPESKDGEFWIAWRTGEFDAIANRLRLITDDEKAAFLNTSAANYSRIQKGRACGATFIAGALHALPAVDFHHLFEIRSGR